MSASWSADALCTSSLSQSLSGVCFSLTSDQAKQHTSPGLRRGSNCTVCSSSTRVHAGDGRCLSRTSDHSSRLTVCGATSSCPWSASVPAPPAPPPACCATAAVLCGCRVEAPAPAACARAALWR
eukprot:CAMPEP_0202879304 /NCGR_PEP_ID=MMETSP1391-20130828/33426_1 /ASSEMBLY_ACC=CAM_ASM_000867 /TAXON_ID=1034604 /ORGANISM="Chlamydomonas leiostraca, Strain SAG 11-49" /LENGTH=124 /DNA_ID=CAMNT_0049561625 /DNA_START=44 /DNA_END=418 /DNA_ORIENTATION=-